MKRFLLLLMFFLLPLSAKADAPFPGSMDDFGRLPILHEGRVKPLDSFARSELRHISGQDEMQKRSAANWLAAVLFDPESTLSWNVFKVEHPDLIMMMELEKRTSHLYSWTEIAKGMMKMKAVLPLMLSFDAKELDPAQRELLQIYRNFTDISMLLNSAAMVAPLEGKDTYIDLIKQTEALNTRLEALETSKGRDTATYTSDESKLIALVKKIQTVGTSGDGNDLFRVIPPQWSDKDEWLSPWIALKNGSGSPETVQLFEQWKKLLTAYRVHDVKAWNAAAGELLALASKRNDISVMRLTLEKRYNDIQPFGIAETLYVLTFIGLMVLRRHPNAVLDGVTFFTGLAGIIAHLVGITSRVIILSRPPVGTLYESLLFVSLIVILFAWPIGYFKNDKRLSFSGLTAALGLLLIAPSVSAQGDSMEMLVAVLNTNFWLATHVICITSAYGISVLAAMMAHVGLYQRATKPLEKMQHDVFDKIVHRVVIMALLLATIGTVLGGIWADQSWGRFWGWDPKENGALLLVLWLIWILHGRLSGPLKGKYFLCVTALLNIVVALSWFGVNLLSVGLHSYGFIGGIAIGLATFCTAEILIIAFLTAQAAVMEKRHAS